MKDKVSLHLNAWGQQLAYFIDTRYMRLEQYERENLLSEERMRTCKRKLEPSHETEKYMTLNEKSLAFRNKKREAGGGFLRYFMFRTRVSLAEEQFLLFQHITTPNAPLRHCGLSGAIVPFCFWCFNLRLTFPLSSLCRFLFSLGISTTG